MNSAAHRLGVALIGAGRMGRIHADIMTRDVPEARLVAVADIDADSAAEVAATTGARAFADHHEAMAMDDVDVVVIVTPTVSHGTIIEDAAGAGLDIFCEKPIALTGHETRAAVSAAAAAGVRLQVGLYRRHDADYLRARERIRDNAIGTPLLVRSLQYDTFVPPVAFCDPAVSGGIAVDMGIHEFDITSWLLDDDIVEVHAYASANHAPELAEVGDADTCLVSLRFASGVVGSVELVRMVGYAEDVRTEVVGTEGSVLIGSLPTSNSAHTSRGLVSVDAPPSAFTRFRPALVTQMRGFCRAVLDHTEVAPRGEEAVAPLLASIAARRSFQLGRPVRLDEAEAPDADP